MKAIYSLMSLKMENPIVETTKEGLLSGDFAPISLAVGKDKYNLNCPVKVVHILQVPPPLLENLNTRMKSKVAQVKLGFRRHLLETLL